MQRHKLRTAGLICAAMSLAVAAVPASVSASASVPASAPPSAAAQPRAGVVVIDCFSKPQVRPEKYLIACGDGNSGLTELKWRDWGRSVARGSGLNVVNDCKPNCAAGKFHSYPVEVAFERPAPWPKNPEQRRYTHLRLVFKDKKPEHLEQDVTYRLWP
ncbi:hypothetical protein ABZ611_13255 [Streptomyces sp. NPDC007861]|uniref:hypothetical protein n=1 Tax=Streptomyces sp. NPDC007861 TaxID=3154893 RepID=UPI003406C2D8